MLHFVLNCVIHDKICCNILTMYELKLFHPEVFVQ